jgi:beta-galactosidase
MTMSPNPISRWFAHGVHSLLHVLLGVVLLGLGNVAVMGQPRSVTSFNSDWRFVKADMATAYEPAFDDSQWRMLELPHDWGVEGAFDQALPGETAKLPYAGIGWYRKHFTVAASDSGSRCYLDVDGAMSDASVWINGVEVGGWAYGYTSWRVNLTPHLRFGGNNVLAIRLHNPDQSSRWYPGGGIYRNVWLVKTAPIHVAHWGVQVTSELAPDGSAAIAVKAEVENHTSQPAAVSVRNDLYELEASGRRGKSAQAVQVGNRDSWVAIPSGQSSISSDAVRLRNPKLWRLDAPQRHLLVTTVSAAGRVLDVVETPFGIRSIRFTAQAGFFLNNQRTEINGVCLHHDLGALGAACNLRARERQLELLKELGCNAIRTSHNPAEPELLDLCDRMGFLVMEEAFDSWRLAKRTNDYHIWFDAWHGKDLRAMIRRDRNHPSVILWSLGNEVYEQHEGTNAPLAVLLARLAHEEDATRPVNMALHIVAASTNGFQNAVDVFGYNYTPFGYGEFRRNNPTKPLIGSETSSCVSTRGAYFFPVSDNKKEGRVNFQCTSYDLAAPAWAMAPDVEFKAQDENPFVAGEFVWTGFDYLGEPTPFDNDTTNRLKFTDVALQARADVDLAECGKIRVPSRSSYFGIFDLCGFRKDRFYLYQSRWRPELPRAHILPHWNWPERAGQVTPVHVYTSGDEAELFLNGKSLGRQRKTALQYRLRWDDVIYQPGELKVVAFKNGKRWATDVVKTTGAPRSLRLTSDRKTISSASRDLAFVTLAVTDQSGAVVPRSGNSVRFRIEGPGKIVATDNGDATSHVPVRALERPAFNGLALAIVRANPGQSGTITVCAEADGLKGATVRIKVRPAK